MNKFLQVLTGNKTSNSCNVFEMIVCWFSYCFDMSTKTKVCLHWKPWKGKSSSSQKMSSTSYTLLNRTHASITFWIISGYKNVGTGGVDTAAVGDTFDISNLDRLGKSEVNSSPLMSVLTRANASSWIEIVPGYVCNPGSPRERDAASKR